MFKINLEKHLSGGVVVGCFMVIDALMILSGHRYYINHIFSMFEMLWFFYSLLAAYQLYQLKRVEKIVPLAYVGFYVFSFVIANYWLAKQGDLEVFPLWYLVFAVVFGLFYFAESIKQLKKQFAKKANVSESKD